jgi:hypothetical protein
MLSATFPCPIGEMLTSSRALVAQLHRGSASRHPTCRSERSHVRPIGREEELAAEVGGVGESR